MPGKHIEKSAKCLPTFPTRQLPAAEHERSEIFRPKPDGVIDRGCEFEVCNRCEPRPRSGGAWEGGHSGKERDEFTAVISGPPIMDNDKEPERRPRVGRTEARVQQR